MQQQRSLKTIKKLIHKALDMIRKLDEEDPHECNNTDEIGNGVYWWATKKFADGSEFKSVLNCLLSALTEVIWS
jgi:hypothetical protein